MKRYTGQQALYEAISRSRAKAKQSSILEKLRPEPAKRENPAAQPSPTTEAAQVAEPVAQEFAEPQVVETPLEPVAGQKPQAEPVEMPPEPVEQFEPAVIVRPVERVAHAAAPGPVRTWLRPRPVQFNEGRIEISVPYYIGVIAGLVVLVIVLTAFRLGQTRSGGQAKAAAAGRVQPVADKTGTPANPAAGSITQNATTDNTVRTQPNPPVSATRQDVAAAAVQGDHWLVLAQYSDRKDLEPVKDHFARNGVELGIMPLDADSRKAFAEAGFNANVLPTGANFLLVTKNLYNNPKTPGTNGYAMKQRITEVGALYKGKAPTGCESFSPNYFSDAYGMKIK